MRPLPVIWVDRIPEHPDLDGAACGLWVDTVDDDAIIVTTSAMAWSNQEPFYWQGGQLQELSDRHIKRMPLSRIQVILSRDMKDLMLEGLKPVRIANGSRPRTRKKRPAA